MVNAHSSQQYVTIFGTLTQPDPGSGRNPWFKATVPAVDIDWEKHAGEGHENDEDTWVGICPVTTNQSQRTKIIVRSPKDDLSLASGRMTLECWPAGTVRFLREDGVTVLWSGASISRSETPLTLYVDPQQAGSFRVTLQGPPDDKSNRPTDHLTGKAVLVELNATDLDGTVADASEETTGAFVHWNLDNDDASNNSIGAPKRAGADYLQTGTEKVADENDLKPLAMSLQPDLNQGSVVLNIANARAKVWKDAEKGSENLVLAGPGNKTWNLADAGQKADFVNLCSSLWVEGVGNGICDIKLSYKDTSGTEICSDKVKYTFIAADCGRQPTTIGTPSQRARFEGGFPKLERCEWSITDNNFPNRTYNCIAWSVGESGTWYNPDYIDQVFGDNDGIFENSDMDAFYNAKKGWHPTASGASDAEAIYYPYPGDWDYLHTPPPATGYHGAKKKGCTCGSGKWIMFESKCGSWEKIEHVWDQLNGSGYGSAGRFYK